MKSLQWQQVNRQHKTIRLEPGTTKNKKARTVPYGQHAALVAIIEQQWTEHVALQKKGIICPRVFHREGSPIKDYRHAWKTATKQAGCPGRYVHDFRRTATRNLTRACTRCKPRPRERRPFALERKHRYPDRRRGLRLP